MKTETMIDSTRENILCFLDEAEKYPLDAKFWINAARGAVMLFNSLAMLTEDGKKRDFEAIDTFSEEMSQAIERTWVKIEARN